MPKTNDHIRVSLTKMRAEMNGAMFQGIVDESSDIEDIVEMIRDLGDDLRELARQTRIRAGVA